MKSVIAKDYLNFMLENLQKEFPNNKYSSPLDIISKEERFKFYGKVRKLWGQKDNSWYKPNPENMDLLLNEIYLKLDDLETRLKEIPNSVNNLDKIKKTLRYKIEKICGEDRITIKSITPKLKKIFGAKIKELEHKDKLQKEFHNKTKFDYDLKKFKDHFFKEWLRELVDFLKKFRKLNNWFEPKEVILEISKLKINKI